MDKAFKLIINSAIKINQSKLSINSANKTNQSKLSINSANKTNQLLEIMNPIINIHLNAFQ